MNHFKTLSFLFFFALLSTSLFAQRPATEVIYAEEGASSVSFPLDVMSVIENKCFGCHSIYGRSDDAKEAFMWTKLQNMEADKLVNLLDEMHEAVEEGKMPPEKIVKKYPSMELSEEDKAVLIAWFNSQIEKLEKGK